MNHLSKEPMHQEVQKREKNENLRVECSQVFMYGEELWQLVTSMGPLGTSIGENIKIALLHESRSATCTIATLVTTITMQSLIFSCTGMYEFQPGPEGTSGNWQLPWSPDSFHASNTDISCPIHLLQYSREVICFSRGGLMDDRKFVNGHWETDEEMYDRWEKEWDARFRLVNRMDLKRSRCQGHPFLIFLFGVSPLIQAVFCSLSFSFSYISCWIFSSLSFKTFTL